MGQVIDHDFVEIGGHLVVFLFGMPYRGDPSRLLHNDDERIDMPQAKLFLVGRFLLGMSTDLDDFIISEPAGRIEAEVAID